jgi:uncharacterized membrane protein YoaK (UPF0700 family)
MSFVAGYVDTVGFVALFGLFTAHVTGNFVLIGASLSHAGAHASGGLLAKLLALPMFVTAVAATTLVVRACERRGRSAVVLVVSTQAVLMATFMLLGLLAAPIEDAAAPLTIVTGMFGVAAMGTQNAAARLVFAHLAPTTVMTGNVTQVVIDTVDLAAGARAAGGLAAAPESGVAEATRKRVRKLLPSVLAFAAGAVGGALGYRGFGFVCLSVAVVALVCVCFIARKPA